MSRFALLFAALLVCASLAADTVTPEMPLPPRLMPDGNTSCGVRADEPTAYAICATPWNGPQVRIELDADGRPLLETRRPYTPLGGTGAINIVAAGATYYIARNGTTLVIGRSGSKAQATVGGSGPLLTWNGGSLLLLTFSNGSRTMGLLLDLSLDPVVAPFAIVPDAPYRSVATAAGGFMVVTQGSDQSSFAAVVDSAGGVRPVALPFDRFRQQMVAGNGSEYILLYQRARMPLDTPRQIIPIVAQRYGVSGDAIGDAITITNSDATSMSIVRNGKEYLIVWSDPYGNAFLRTLDGAPQPLGKGQPWLINGSAGLFLLTSDYNQPMTIRRLDTNGAEHVLAYGYVYEYVAAAASDGLQTAVVWNEGTAIRIGRFAIDGTCLDGAGVELPIDHTAVIAPAISFGGASYLVVWWNSDAKIKGVFFGRDGKLSGDPFVISDEKRPGTGITPGVTWTGTNYVVAWSSSTWGLGSGAIVTPSGLVTPFKFANGVQMPAVAAGPRNLVVYLDYGESLAAKVSGVFLDAAGEPFEIAREWGPDLILIEPRIATNGHDYLVTWQRESYWRRSEALVARLDDRGRLIGKPFVAAASETPHGARAVPLFDGNNYRVVVSGDPAMPLFSAQLDDATIACGCFAERTAIPIDFDFAATGLPAVAAASPEALVIAYGRPFANDPTYGSAPRVFLRIVRATPPPWHRAVGR